MAVLRGFRSVLDFIYLAAGVLAALSLIAILVLIVVQMLARWTGEVFPGAPDFLDRAFFWENVVQTRNRWWLVAGLFGVLLLSSGFGFYNLSVSFLFDPGL